jgi:MFS family permease
MKPNSFLNRDFLLLSQGQLVNQAGSQIALVATAFWLKQSTESAGLVGLMTAVSALPLLLLAPVGGAVADRWSRRNILILCDLFCGAVACALAVLLQMHLPRPLYLTTGLFAGNLILSSAIAFTSPAMNALTPSLVPADRIGAAMAFSQVAGLLALILGQLLGGIFSTHFAPAMLFWMDAATYFVSAMAECFVRADPNVTPGNVIHGITHDIAEGFQYVWRRRGMRALLFAAIPLNIFSTPVIVLLPFYTTNVLREPLARYGYLLAAVSVGLLIGYGLAGRFPPPAPHRHTAVFAGAIGCSVAVLALASLSFFPEAMILLCALGCLIGVVTLICLSTFIRQTEPQKRGRVAAVLMMVTQGVTPLAMSLIGVVSDFLGNNMRLLYAACGWLLLGSAIVMATNRDLRQFLQSE